MIRARPLVQSGPRPSDALPLAGGPLWFRDVEMLVRGRPPRFIPAQTLDDETAERLSAPRAPVAGLAMDRPHVMGILNATPDSFSDGGDHVQVDVAVAAAERMAGEGVSILDIGGESTRPGAETVAEPEEVTRVLPVIEAVREELQTPISIDTRKSRVARAALAAGADIFNDVSALTFDGQSLDVVRRTGAPVCLMHAQGDPQTMQDAPHYKDVLLDVYDWLERRVLMIEAHGVRRDRMLIDPGIGFGKTLEHNLALLRGLSLFHGLGCPVLVGASRKRFIGTIAGVEDAKARDPGSHAVLAAALGQGVQVVRVHDTGGAMQTLRLWRALNDPNWGGAQGGQT
ncbi:dihydropteroate synthase [Pontivivens ytuae]|uniref:Dihydropteroate synthase n=1 Tax=Pontivivens ytuae TaxID=2789856 RepID=A0A7S9QD04_9RHOB|nr:dihydropteroate synthase [Pontivivens ytuae]QPH54380.1 dihydropteroate synthase [Pontivivens ytuae]